LLDKYNGRGNTEKEELNLETGKEEEYRKKNRKIRSILRNKNKNFILLLF
jgi:hypothetical protein